MATLKELHELACAGRDMYQAEDIRGLANFVWRTLLPTIDILAAQEHLGLEFEVALWCHQDHPIFLATDEEGNTRGWLNFYGCPDCTAMLEAIRVATIRAGKELKSIDGTEWATWYNEKCQEVAPPPEWALGQILDFHMPF